MAQGCGAEGEAGPEERRKVVFVSVYMSDSFYFLFATGLAVDFPPSCLWSR